MKLYGLLICVFVVMFAAYATFAATPILPPYVVSATKIGNVQNVVIVKVGATCQAVYEIIHGPRLGVNSSFAVAVTSWPVECPTK